MRLFLTPSGRYPVTTEQLAVTVDHQMLGILQHFHIAPFGAGDPIIIAVNGCVSVLVGTPFQHKVRGRDIDGQLFKIRFFILKHLGGDQTGFRCGSCRPFELLPTQRPVGSYLQDWQIRAPEKNWFQPCKTPFHCRLSCFACPCSWQTNSNPYCFANCAISGFITAFFPVPAKTGQICVVNDALRCRIAPKAQCFMKKTFHLEPIKCAVKFQIPHLAVAKI